MQMNGGRFGYEGPAGMPPQESYINTTVLNALIYEYLVKKSYTGTAKVFKVEGDVSGINITSGSSALLDWFVAFNDLYNVRSGRGRSSGIVSKIDAVLGKNASQEERMRSSECRGGRPRFNTAWYEKAPGPPKERKPPIPRSISAEHAPRYMRDVKDARDGDLLNTILEIDDGDFSSQHAAANGTTAARQASPVRRKPIKPMPPGFSPRGYAPEQPFASEKEAQNYLVMKEISSLKLHDQKVSTMSVCHRKKILVTGSADASVCVVDLATLTDVVKFEAHTMQVSQVKVKDSNGTPADSPMYFGSASLDREAKIYKVTKIDGKLEVSMLLYLKGHKSSIKALDFGETKTFTMGIDGELRVWSTEGACVGAYALRRTIRTMVARSDRMIVIGDINSVSLFDPEFSTYTKEVSQKGAISHYKSGKNLLLAFSDSVVIYDHNFQNSQVIPFLSDKIHSSCMAGGRLFLGGYQVVYELCEKSVLVSQVHDGIVSALEGTVISNKNVLLTGSNEGDVKIWEVPLERTASVGDCKDTHDSDVY